MIKYDKDSLCHKAKDDDDDDDDDHHDDDEHDNDNVADDLDEGDNQ